MAPEDEHPTTMGARALRDALAMADVSVHDLKIVLFVGYTRDYLPFWSVSNEILRILGGPAHCIGLDIAVGCAAVVPAIDVLTGWLRNSGGGFGAIVCSDRVSQIIDFKDETHPNLWSWSDGAGALVAGVSPRPALGVFSSSSYINDPSFNDIIMSKSGGSRQPNVNIEHGDHFLRLRQGFDTKAYFDIHKANYEKVFDAQRAALGGPPDWLACTQMHPKVQANIGRWLGIDDTQVITTGFESGHVGSVDPIIGLKLLIDSGRKGNVFFAANTTYCWASSLIRLF